MHTDLAPHLHSDNCNELIKLLQQCHNENPFLRIFGKCNSEDHRMVMCLKQERLQRRKRNYQKSLETKEKLRKMFEEERKKKQAI
ncbi:COX assembly mitochondrial protein 2 homolog [Diorhabda carinulata]|uniref:COX assembly mitochondrial protein 2 homolog n=1 Tax=Diorhabda sublineata TaxID=1163346 RepID=UPI0024E0943B|nr:COX assembly mitochondrial protein 2 homolog [Diorhabda sublineata]XP_057650952.1 COX assembly mitochondrial protein 2 homolog [Diorhabda carinulata]